MDTKKYSEISRIEENITDKIINENDEDLYVNESLGTFLTKELISWVLIFIFAFAVSYAINKFVIETTEVVGESMLPTFKPGEKLLINKLSVKLNLINRGDIIVFLPDNESKNYVKRIIALPGETVDIRDGKVYINDELLNEDYLEDTVITNKLFNGKEFPYTLGSKEYFALGDNRSNSFDCRSSEIGAITTERMRGKVMLRIYPLERFNFFSKITYNNSEEALETNN